MSAAFIPSPAERWRAEVEAACSGRDPSSREIIALLRCCPPGRWGRISAVAECTGRAWGSISALAWVADHLAPGLEGRDVSVSHLIAVVGLPALDQRRLLSEAEQQGLSTPALRQRIAEAQG